jgi:hypothetical protein
VSKNICYLYIRQRPDNKNIERSKLNSPKVNKPIKKGATELNRTFSKEEIQMAKKHIKKCSPSLVWQIKTTISFHLTPVRIAIIKKNTTNKCWQGCREKRTLIHCYWECKLIKALWKFLWRFLKNLNIDLSHNPAIPLLGIYPKECDSGYYKSICTLMFITALLTIAKLLKQPKCPTTDEWIKKKSGIHTV